MTNLKAKVRELPNKPGGYLMRDRLGRVIYVGKARSLRKRVSQYFHPSSAMRWERFIGCGIIRKQAEGFDYHSTAPQEVKTRQHKPGRSHTHVPGHAKDGHAGSERHRHSGQVGRRFQSRWCR